MNITRRTFVKGVSAGAAALALESQFNLLTTGAPDAFAAEPTYAPYVCKMCSGGCMAKAKIVDGVVTELMGVDGSQTSRGRLCVKGLSAIRQYKNPRRVTKPLIRTNPEKGPGVDPRWREASWNEAMALIAEKMKTAIETPGHGARSIVLGMRPSPGDITKRLALAIGTPNDTSHHDTCYTSYDIAFGSTAYGSVLTWTQHASGSDYILDEAAGTVTRVEGGAIASGAQSQVYVVYIGTDGKRYTDWVEFDVDTKALSRPIDSAAMAPRVLSPAAGTARNWTHDLARSTYILSFGWDMPGKAKNMMAQDFVHAVSQPGAKAVVFDPRLSTTASLAKQNGGEWIPVKPGSDLAVAFAMMKVVIGNGIHVSAGGTGIWNKVYVDGGVDAANFALFIDHIKGNGFAGEDGSIPGGTGDGGAADIAAVLAWADGKSGVAAATIERIAREFANDGAYPETHKPYIPTHKRDAGGPNYRNSLEMAHSTILLNTLVGAIDRLGGAIKEIQHPTKNLGHVCPMPPGFKLPTYERMDHLQRSPLQSRLNKGSYQYMADSILSEDPYPIDVVMLRKYNVLGLPDSSRMVEALKKVFLIAIELQMSETAQMADVVLPETFWFEGRGWDKAQYFALWSQLMVTPGKMPRLHPHTSDATIEGAGQKGWRDILLKEFPNAFGDWVNPATGRKVKDLFRYAPGGSYDDSNPVIWQAVPGKGASWAYDDVVLKDAFGGMGWDDFAALPNGLYPDNGNESFNIAGGEFPVPHKTFTPKYGTATNRIEMYSTSFEAYGYDPLPVWKGRRQEKSGVFDLYMVVDHPAPHIHSQTQDLDFNTECHSEAVLWMYPATAMLKGIATGDTVNVQARPVGDKGTGRTVQMRAFVTDRIKSDVVCFPHGWGHWSRDYEDYAKRGANDGEMIPVPPISEILAENTPQPGVRMTDVVVNVYK